MIEQGDAELNYSHFALQKLHLLTSALESMSRWERALVYASIDLRVKEEKRQAAKMKM